MGQFFKGAVRDGQSCNGFQYWDTRWGMGQHPTVNTGNIYDIPLGVGGQLTSISLLMSIIVRFIQEMYTGVRDSPVLCS
jgi:hypothetical protein